MAAPDLPRARLSGAWPRAARVRSSSPRPCRNEQGVALHRYALKDHKADEFMKGVPDVDGVAGPQEGSCVKSGNELEHRGRRRAPPKVADGRLALGTCASASSPRQEWAQMLRDGWRFMRDFLYVDNTHGAPWNDVWQWYSAWLPDVEHRSDFNRLLDMVSGEISVGHSYVRGGDYPGPGQPAHRAPGRGPGAGRAAPTASRAIYTGEAGTPGLAGPLAEPGMDVKEGDYLVAVAGPGAEGAHEPVHAPRGHGRDGRSPSA